MRKQLLWLMAGTLISLSVAACATTGGPSSEDSKADENQRETPPEITDHTVDDRTEVARSTRPRVDVSLDPADLPSLDPEEYEGSVRRDAQQCYNQSVSGKGSKAEGAVVYEVIVTRNGYVAGTDIMSTGLRDEAIESCVEQVISRLRFEVPVRNRPVFRLFFRLEFYLETMIPTEPPV